MTVYEALSLAIAFAILVIKIIDSSKRKK